MLLWLLSLPLLGQQSAGTLSIGQATAPAGSTVALPMTYVANTAVGTQPAAFQFTLNYAKTLANLVVVTAGTMATGNGKQIACNAVVGTLSVTQMCLVYGLNMVPITGTGIAAWINVNLPSTFSGSTGFSLTNMVAATPGGSALTLSQGTTGKITKLSYTGSPAETTSTTTTQTQAATSARAGVEIHLLTNFYCQDTGEEFECEIDIGEPAETNLVISTRYSDPRLGLPRRLFVPPGNPKVKFSIIKENWELSQGGGIVLILERN